MSENIITTKNLTFSYGMDKVLDNINLEIPRGSIYGYLGKNGAGKTTTINLMLKLLSVERDTIFYNKEDISTLGEKYFSNIGTLIQPISLYRHMTCYEQLKYFSYLFNVDKANIDKVLKDVDMYDQRNKKIKVMSTGMKQRLAIAAALLHNPDLLMLDEPINGLDPNGIKEFRELIMGLNRDGKTIFISSHLLGEMQKICSHIGIIDSGKLLFQDNLSNMKSLMPTQIKICTSDNVLAKDVLQNMNIEKLSITENNLSFELDDNKQYARAVKAICEKDIDIFDISRKEIDLESFYLTLIK